MYKVDIRGCDGITKTVIINSPDSIPAVWRSCRYPGLCWSDWFLA
jgi:hypothetical protein